VLEAAFGLVEDLSRGGAKAGLVVCFFDGEEWGLLGSRALVPALTAAYDVRAMVNVDAVGRVREDAVHVVGLTKAPALAATVVEGLTLAGLRVGRDIDAYAYDSGSDHWPFHQAGIPAVDLYASDYATMDTPQDVVEDVDPVGVARIASALRATLLRLGRSGS
jgi:Zn-dependent M28 family amino/carboxypeptidase